MAAQQALKLEGPVRLVALLDELAPRIRQLALHSDASVKRQAALQSGERLLELRDLFLVRGDFSLLAQELFMPPVGVKVGGVAFPVDCRRVYDTDRSIFIA